MGPTTNRTHFCAELDAIPRAVTCMRGPREATADRFDRDAMMVVVTDRELPVLASGFGVGGAQWTLTTHVERNRMRTMVQVVEPDGRRWGAGFGGRPVPPDRRVATFVGRSGESSHLVIVRVAPEVRAVRATLSDGTVDDLSLHGDVDRLGARIAVLVYPAPLDLHRLTLLDGRGQELPDML